MRKSVIVTLFLVLALSGCGAPAAQTPEPTILPSDLIDAFRSAYSQTEVGDYYRMEYSGGSFYLVGTWDNIATTAAKAQQGDPAESEKWAMFSSEIMDIYSGVREDLDKYGYDNSPLVGLLVNEKGTKNALLRIEGGIITYDVSAVKVVLSQETAPADTQPTSQTSTGPAMGEEQALKKALSYLDTSAFSRSGLIDQLVYSKFTKEQAEYAVDHCGADWNEQALKKAQSYLSTSAFSESGLIDQLEYNGFTEDQAMYGVSRTYTDWNEQAAKKAKSYLSTSSFSYERLVDQLMYSGFTKSQAVYGANANGYYG